MQTIQQRKTLASQYWSQPNHEWLIKPEPEYFYGRVSNADFPGVYDISRMQDERDNLKITVTDGKITAVELIK